MLAEAVFVASADENRENVTFGVEGDSCGTFLVDVSFEARSAGSFRKNQDVVAVVKILFARLEQIIVILVVSDVDLADYADIRRSCEVCADDAVCIRNKGCHADKIKKRRMVRDDNFPFQVTQFLHFRHSHLDDIRYFEHEKEAFENVRDIPSRLHIKIVFIFREKPDERKNDKTYDHRAENDVKYRRDLA